MKRLLLFAGTSEGRLLAEALVDQPIEVTACAATEYGRELLPDGGQVHARAGRLSLEEMTELTRTGGFDWVVDATHPYADQATANIRKAARAAGLPYLRLLRGEERAAAALEKEALWLERAGQAAERLAATPGRALLTTGSKDLAVYSALPDFTERVFVRVLPVAESLERCHSLGLAPSHILAMQGPFSQEFNEALIRQWQIDILITKESGGPGGFAEKAAAARNTGARLWVIGRPLREEGYTLEELTAYFQRRLGGGR